MQNAMVRVMDPAAAVDEAELQGEEGEIEILHFEDDGNEATQLADTIAAWIDNEGVPPSEIAVLVSKQQNLYCQKLHAALEARGVPFRIEDNAQDLASEPVASLIVDFLLVVAGSRQAAAYRRLLDLLIFSQGLDEEREYQARSRWDNFVREARRRIAEQEIRLTDLDDLVSLVTELLAAVGHDAVVALSPDYVRADRLQEIVAATIDRVHQLLPSANDAVSALASFSGDRAVRIMSIHKSKGLEFDSVIVLGVEHQTFWSDAEAERSAFFVGISRAKRRLVLTVCAERERPEGAPRWDRNRNEQEEYLGYAHPYL
jgi:superfamily I DNA/RNA helicase